MLWCYLSFFSKLIAVPSIHKFEAMKGLVQPAESVLLMPSQVRSGRLRCHLQSQQRIVQILFRMIVNANIWIFRLPRCTKMLAEQIPSILSARLGRETPAWLFSDTTGSEWGCMVRIDCIIYFVMTACPVLWWEAGARLGRTPAGPEAWSRTGWSFYWTTTNHRWDTTQKFNKNCHNS